MCLKEEIGRGHLQPFQGCEQSRSKGADLTHEAVTSHLNKALFFIGEVGAMEKMGEEIKEAARLSASSPNHNKPIFNENLNLECSRGGSAILSFNIPKTYAATPT